MKSPKSGISIIIVSSKPKILTSGLETCPWDNEILIDRSRGIATARNRGAARARHDWILFVDDDVMLSPKIWEHLRFCGENEFMMYQGVRWPIGRVMFMPRAVFQSLKFSLENEYAGEDLDFYLRAIDAGYRYVGIPVSLANHIPHRQRSSMLISGVRVVRDQTGITYRHWRRHRDIVTLGFWDNLKNMHFLSFFLNWVFLLSFIIIGYARDPMEMLI